MRIETLNDLLGYCEAHHMPLDKMHFYIGENVITPKAFGIYQNELTGKWIVYKNKANGERVVRYQGDNEAEAVSIILDKLKEEAGIRKNNKLVKKRQTQAIAIFVAFVFIICIVFFFYVSFNSSSVKDGYYVADDQVYYYQDDTLYYYDYDYGDWYIYPDEMDEEFYEDDYYGSDYTSDDVGELFSDSDYYEDDYDNYDDDYGSSDDDDDYSDWDSSDTDWDSDW